MTIKDEFSAIKAVMFKSANMRLKFMPENSMSVIIRGRVAVFERDGVYQLYVTDIQPDGAGAADRAGKNRRPSGAGGPHHPLTGGRGA